MKINDQKAIVASFVTRVFIENSPKTYLVGFWATIFQEVFQKTGKIQILTLHEFFCDKHYITFTDLRKKQYM